MREPEEERWRRRPVVSALLYVGALAIPVVVSTGVGLAVSRRMPPAHGVWEGVGFWGAVVGSSIMTMLMVERLSRQLLPLAALYKLSMVFPDRVPSRFSVALRSGSVSRLPMDLGRVSGRVDADPGECAAEMLSLVTALTVHDRQTRGHSERVRAFTELLAEQMGLARRDRDLLRWASLLHDVGKVAVDERILNKPGGLDEAEIAAVRIHPAEGARLTAALLPWLGPWALSIVQHHERWDGTGYPAGLHGKSISLGARMVSVADAFETMTAPRPYKKVMTAEEGRQELARCAGTHFDPDVVRAFLNISIGKLRWATRLASTLLHIPFTGLFSAAGRQLAMAGATGGVLAVLATAGALAGPTPSEAPVAAPPTRVEGPSAGAASRTTRAVPAPGPAEPASTIPSGPGSAISSGPAPVPGPDSPEPTPAAPALDEDPPTIATLEPSSDGSADPAPEEPVAAAGAQPAEPVAGSTFVFRLGGGGSLSPDGSPEGGLPDYDGDGHPGATVRRTPNGFTESDPAAVVAWRAAVPEGYSVAGPAGFTFWSALSDFREGRARVDAFLFDCASDGSDCVLIGSGTVADVTWGGGTWTQRALDLVDVTRVFGADRELVLKVTVHQDSRDSLWLAYGTSEFESVLELTPT